MNTQPTSPDVRPPSEASGVEPWTVRGVWHTWWRVPVIGLLAAMIAFVGSFLVPEEYAASTRILIRGRDTAVLSGNGQTLEGQPGVIDSQLATALSDTQSALLSTRTVADEVVNRLKLDEKPKKSGVVAKMARFSAAAYARTRAFVTFGFYKQAPKHQAAVNNVYEGLSAKQVSGGYVIEITGTGETGKEAQEITNTAADVLVEVGNIRYSKEADAYRDFLDQELQRALRDQQQANRAVASYKEANGIVSLPDEIRFSSASADQLRTQIAATQAQLDGARAAANSLRNDLNGASPTQGSSQNITTGRSTTQVDTNAPSGSYEDLLSRSQSAEANADSLAAQLSALQSALGRAEGGTGGAPLSEAEQQLGNLELQADIATETVNTLSQQLTGAQVNANRGSVSLTRLDSAPAPVYPVSPKRYLYLGVGLLLGLVVGFVWTFLRQQRLRAELGDEDDRGPILDTETIDLSAEEPDADEVQEEPISVQARVGPHSNGGDVEE